MKEPTLLECPVCQTKKEENAFIETYISPFNNQKYKLYHCETCDLQWWEPLKIIPEFYEGEGDEGYEFLHSGLREEIDEQYKMFFRHIPLKSGRLLDVGCGDGVFLKEARKAGYEVWGIDFDSKSIKVCHEKWGLKNTFAMTPQEFTEFCQKEDLKFDIITFFAVLEHQDKPKEFLETIKRMLKPEGYIAGTVPNRDSWEVKKLGRVRYTWDFPPNHFLRFSGKALYNLYNTTRFRNILIKPTPISIEGLISNLQIYITGPSINKILRKKITTHELAGEGTTIYKKLPAWRKGIFKTLKVIRFLMLFPIALIIKFNTTGFTIYFQAKV